MNENETQIKDLIFSLRSLRKETRRIFAYQAKKQQLTETWIIALGALTSKDPSSLEELAQALRLSNSTTSGIVDRMIAEGLVTKARAEDNKRRINIRPTQKGRQKYAATYTDFWEKLAPLETIERADLTNLLATQAKLLAKLERIN
ncbi:MarR family winged helix-turn-helix transcriptional regulator [Loigolactobacillus coryniformis]|uniref:MarR family winged helix-turn-helix transcriptional regulator n=1 Tax=Loigolactobacillus coryniformis TaxID=1610 RepID=UPI001C5F021A|nr:MarR family transcriptional regulator [Loigolactobacillus coryniformis]MBW4801235.1 MarR family transcriptional regulator [Loigolactobacillus coryniformis subsp. torquens]MBW4803938.1 MarR family transcriptional regulator [Loigolactobacillus coryniformis subsp. torquens]